MKLKHVKLVKYAIAIGIIIFLIAFFALLRLNENVSEYFFARGISRAYVFVAGNITDIFGFSVFGVLVILAVCALITIFAFIIYFLKKKRRTEALALLEKTVLSALCVALIYVMTAGGCYNRKEMPLPKYEGEQLSVAQTVEIMEAYYKDFNLIADSLEYSDGASVCPYSFDELGDILIEEYKRLDKGYFSSYTPKIKKAVTSKLMSYTGTCGITFQPTGEAVINYETPSAYLVVTAAHELAHAKGVMRERDANLLAYYILITSDKPYLRYSGYLYSLGYLSSTLAILDPIEYERIIGLYPEKASVDSTKAIEFWATKSGFLNEIGDFFNNLYLKLSGIEEGTANYSDPSDVVIEEEIIDEKPVEVKKIHYSDTAKMLIYQGFNLLNA